MDLRFPVATSADVDFGQLGGGPLGDLGIYCINAARYTIDEEPIEVIALQCQPKSAFPRSPGNRELSPALRLRGDLGMPVLLRHRPQLELLGVMRKGSIHMNPAYTYSGLRLWTQGEEKGIPSRTDLMIEPIDQFAAEMDNF